MIIRCFAVASALVLAGCASTSVTPVSKNQFIISTSAAPACGRSGAMKVAAKMAAVETLRRGYPRFMIGGAQSENNVSAIRTAPTYANTSSSYNAYGNSIYGNSTTTFGGGGTMLVGSNDAGLMVMMLMPGDRDYDQGLDAKSELGPDWEKLVKSGVNSCAD